MAEVEFGVEQGLIQTEALVSQDVQREPRLPVFNGLLTRSPQKAAVEGTSSGGYQLANANLLETKACGWFVRSAGRSLESRPLHFVSPPGVVAAARATSYMAFNRNQQHGLSGLSRVRSVGHRRRCR